MIAVLGTLPFLATLWLVLVVGAAMLEESGAKIVAALKGEPSQQQSANAGTRRDRKAIRTRTPNRVNVPLRAAA
jgi:hypothetical protein